MPRAARQSKNQALFRAVNERIAALANNLAGSEGSHSFICECSRAGCAAQVEIPLAVYAEVRQAANAYLVLVGHEDPDHELILAGHGNYRIVSPQTDAAATRRPRLILSHSDSDTWAGERGPARSAPRPLKESALGRPGETPHATCLSSLWV